MAAQSPDPYSAAESMSLKPGDRIVYRERDIYQVREEGTKSYGRVWKAL